MLLRVIEVLIVEALAASNYAFMYYLLGWPWQIAMVVAIVGTLFQWGDQERDD